MRPNAALLPALLLSLLSLAACQSTPKEPDPIWSKGQVQVSSDRVLWKVMLLALEKQGFPLAGGLDPSSGVLTTGWRNDLAPFSGEGRRQQAELHMRPLHAGTWEVTARIKQQKNMSIAKPLDLRYAEWEWIPDDAEGAQVLLQHIRARLGPDIELQGPKDAVQAILDSKEGQAKP